MLHEEFTPSAIDPSLLGLSPDRCRQAVAQLDDTRIAAAITDAPAALTLVGGMMAHSPYLCALARQETEFLRHILIEGPDATFGHIMSATRIGAPGEATAALMARLRIAKRRLALTLALADLAGVWPLLRLCEGLSDFADAALAAALAHQLEALGEVGTLPPRNDRIDPLQGCGFFVLAMGKLGARELNYSSDIDLILLYDAERTGTTDPQNLSRDCTRLTRDMMRIIDQRTAEGYVFRTDLRLRPDPGVTPLAVNMDAAEIYYESLGQNWERAAMIKARPAAGDLDLARTFLRRIRPFIWRKNLDFAAINDIHSIKRQINSHRGGAAIAVAGHDVKIGRGGIREIEFFVQTQQLIWGGRRRDLRAPRTLDGLTALSAGGIIDPQTAAELRDSYHFLRRLEHRLQMVNDEQTQKLPVDENGLARIGAFMGLAQAVAFHEQVRHHLERVAFHYARLFEESTDLSGGAALVFTGSENDPETVRALEAMGFRDGERVAAQIRGWHHGRYRAMRSERARQLLTELTPELLQVFARTDDPDEAFGRLDFFLERIPAGVQLFSLFQANPHILELVAQIMGNAPRLADWLSRKPMLLDAMITPDLPMGMMTAGGNPNTDADAPAHAPSRDVPDPTHRLREESMTQLAHDLAQADDYQDSLDVVRRWTGERKFAAGMLLLRGDIDAVGAAPMLSLTADCAISAMAQTTADAFAETHGQISGGCFALLAFGKLGGEEMMPGSDVDLVFIYDHDPHDSQSDGARPLGPAVYYLRLCQRMVTAISSLTGEGRLYVVDSRLRPGGESGPLATRFGSFANYYAPGGVAWTWEYMALSRARVIHGPPTLRRRINSVIARALRRHRDPAQLMQDVDTMRQRIAREFPARTPWDIKYRKGGLVDVEFIVQALQLCHGAHAPQILSPHTGRALQGLRDAGVIGADAADDLLDAYCLWRHLQTAIRLTCQGEFDAGNAPEGQRRLLVRMAGAQNFADLERRTEEAATATAQRYEELIRTPAQSPPQGENS